MSPGHRAAILLPLAALAACAPQAPAGDAAGPARQEAPAMSAPPSSRPVVRALPRDPLDGPPELDALDEVPRQAPIPAALATAMATAPRGTVHLDDRLGRPSFLWGAAGTTPGGAGTTRAGLARLVTLPHAGQARFHLRERAALYGLDPADVDRAEATVVHDLGRGPVIVRLRQAPGGREVFREEARVALGRDGRLLAITGAIGQADPPATSRPATLDDRAAVAAALADVSGVPFVATDLAPATAAGRWRALELTSAAAASRAARLTRPARARETWFRLPTGLEPAWHLEVGLERAEGGHPLDFAVVLSAVDGRVLLRHSQRQDTAFGYRVWAQDVPPYFPDDGPQGTQWSPHPTGVPDGFQPSSPSQYATRRLVTLDHLPSTASGLGPWLAADATTTRGNNAFAYADRQPPTGYQAASNDLAASTTGPGLFDYPYDLARSPEADANQIQAAVVQLFYDVNVLHDFWYLGGFDELSGNFQASNLGRGGFQGDAVNAEAMDWEGTDNANMSTPSDGAAPRLQMYLFHNSDLRRITVSAPPALAGVNQIGTAQFGPPTFDLSGTLQAAVPFDACTVPAPAAGNVAVPIALVVRGGTAPGGACFFKLKAANVLAAGFQGLVIVNNVSGLISMADTNTVTQAIPIPVAMVPQALGNALKGSLDAGQAATVRLERTDGLRRDGTLDFAVVSHEFGHGVSNRLIADATGLTNPSGGAMGEGWSDFQALLFLVRAEDAGLPANPGWSGAYALAAWDAGGLDGLGQPNQGYYRGIRRVPYSTDPARDPLSFRHVSDYEPLPPGVAGGGIPNSEVHAAGEVWATMLWECWAELLADPRFATFADARDRMRDELVAALKLTNPTPTYLEARDALLVAALAHDPLDYLAFWRAFAKRGAGVGARGPDRLATDGSPVVESYLAGGELVLESASFGPVLSACDDADGVLDEGEEGFLVVRLRNAAGFALPASVASLASGSVHLQLAGGATVAVPPVPVGGVAEVPVRVRLSGASPAEVVALTLSFPPGGPVVANDLQVVVRTNTDEAGAASAGDGFETQQLAWTSSADVGFVAGAGGALFRRVEVSPADHHLLGPDQAAPSDVRLTSPPLHVAASGNLTLSFRQVHDFEVGAASAANFLDGAVVELSTDGGASWTDVGSPLYGGTLTAGAGNPNPLAGRAAVVGRNPSWPGWDAAALDLGAAHAGQTVLLRFRIGTDGSNRRVLPGGWALDDVELGGLVDTPFPALVPDARHCVGRAPVADAGPNQAVATSALVTLDGRGSHAPDSGDAIATWAWNQVYGRTVILAGADTAQPTFTSPPALGASPLTFRLTVTDALHGLSSSAEVNVVGLVNHAPVATAGANQAVAPGATVSLDATGSTDADLDPLHFAWTQVDGPAVVLAGAATATSGFTAPSLPSESVLHLRVTVSDGLASSSADVTVTVQAVPPQASGSRSGCGCGAGAGDPLALLGLGLAAALRRRRSE